MFNLNSNFIKKIKNFFFPFYKNSELKFVFKKLQEGFQNETKVAMFVGGCVRKYLSNEKIDDIDIATVFSCRSHFRNCNWCFISYLFLIPFCNFIPNAC